MSRFSLWHTLLMQLGRPQEAAAAFAEVRRMSPAGAFAEDALAREVEALSQAGQRAQMEARAREYLRLPWFSGRVPFWQVSRSSQRRRQPHELHAMEESLF